MPLSNVAACELLGELNFGTTRLLESIHLACTLAGYHSSSCPRQWHWQQQQWPHRRSDQVCGLSSVGPYRAQPYLFQLHEPRESTARKM